MKKIIKIKNSFIHLIKILVQRLLRVLRSRNGWKWASASVLLIATLAFSLMQFTITKADTVTLYPNGDVVTGWPDNDGTGNDGTCISNTTHCSRVDDNTSGQSDWIGTGTNGTTGEIEEYDLTTQTVVSATQIQINVVVDSIIASTADTLSINLRVNGTAQTAQTCTMNNGVGQTCTATFSGTWNQAAVDSMRAIITRNRQGSGNQSSQDDDIRMHRVYASLTYTAPSTYEQSAYRWFDNTDAADATYAKAYGGSATDKAVSVATASDGGFVVFGETSSSGQGSSDVYLAKYDTSGSRQWLTLLGGVGAENAGGVVAAADGYYVAGTTASTTGLQTDAFVVKYDLSGNQVWYRLLTESGVNHKATALLLDGTTLVVVGSTTESGSEDAYVARITTSGTLTDIKRWGGSGTDYATAVTTSAAGYVLAGVSNSSGLGTMSDDVFIAFFDKTTATFTESEVAGVSNASSVETAGGIVAVGSDYWIVGSTTFGFTNPDVMIAKYSTSAGSFTLETRTASLNDLAKGVKATSDGGFIIVGQTNSFGSGGSEAFLMKYNSSGTYQWMKTIGVTGSTDIGYGVIETASGYTAVGETGGFGSIDAMTINTDSSGNISGCSSPNCTSQTLSSSSPTANTVDADANASVASGIATLASSPTMVIGAASLGAKDMFGSVDVGTDRAALNTPAIAPSEGTIFRLRLDLHIGGGTLAAGAGSFKLKYADKGANASCSVVPGGSYADVSATSTGIRYANNLNAGTGHGLTPNANDPTHNGVPGDTLVRQNYIEAAATTWTNSRAISAGQDGMWDFALTTYHALENTTYCFRVVDGAGGNLNTYTVYPEITTPSASLGQASYRWFDPAASSSTFVKAYGGAQGDNGVDIAVTPDGGYVITGDTRSYDDGTYTAFVAKYGASGGLEWARTLGAAGVDKGKGVVVTPSGDVVITGSVDDYGAGQDDAFMAKFSSTGTFQWMRTLGTTSSDVAKGITIDANGDFAIVGQTYGYGSSDAFIAKVSSTGALQWMTVEGGTGSDDGNAITTTSDGGYAIAGVHASDAFVAKYSSSGSRSWIKTIGAASTDYAYGIMQDADGNFVLTGQVYAGSTYGTDAFIAKYVPGTDTWAWFKNLGGTGTDIGYDLARDGSNNYYLVGYTISFSGAGNADAFLAKYDPSGTLSWFKTFNGSSGDYVVSLAKTSDNRFALTGQISTPPGTGSLDILLAVYDSNGNIDGCPSYCASPTPNVGNLTNAAAAPTSTATSQTPTVGQYNDTSTDNPRVTTISPTTTNVVASAAVGAPLAAQNVPYDVDQQKPVNLRMTVSVSNSGLVSGASFKLQFADKGANASCSVVTGGNYADVTTSTALYYYDGADTSGTSIGSIAGDPTDSGITNVPQTYQEANPFSTTSNVYAGQNALWQFSLAIQPGSMKGKSYCVRIVRSTGFMLDTYSTFSEVAYAPTMARLMKGGKWFDHSGVKRPLAL